MFYRSFLINFFLILEYEKKVGESVYDPTFEAPEIRKKDAFRRKIAKTIVKDNSLREFAKKYLKFTTKFSTEQVKQIAAAHGKDVKKDPRYKNRLLFIFQDTQEPSQMRPVLEKYLKKIEDDQTLSEDDSAYEFSNNESDKEETEGNIFKLHEAFKYLINTKLYLVF